MDKDLAILLFGDNYATVLVVIAVMSLIIGILLSHKLLDTYNLIVIMTIASIVFIILMGVSILINRLNQPLHGYEYNGSSDTLKILRENNIKSKVDMYDKMLYS